MENFKSIFDEQYPGLGAEIGANAPSSTNDTEKKWWETLIQTVPDIVGIFVPTPTSGQTPAVVTTQNTQSAFNAKNIIILGLVVIAILFAYKYIFKK